MKHVLLCILTGLLLPCALGSAHEPREGHTHEPRRETPLAVTRTGDSPAGMLRVTIRDEHGRETPAMLAVNDRATGQPVEYGITPLRQGMHQRRRFPGYSRRPQWEGEAPLDVDGSREIALPAGEYELHVGKGLEYTPVRRLFRVDEGRTTDVDITLERFINLPARGWWPGDDHVHLKRPDTSSDRDLWVMAMAEDIHVINMLQMGSFSDVAFLQPGFGKEHRVYLGDHALVPGQEEPRTGRLGHTISLNTTDFIRFADHYFQYERIWKQARQQGAVTGYAHVLGYSVDEHGRPIDMEGRPIDVDDWRPTWGKFDCDMGLTLDVPDGYVDFVEILDNNNRLMPRIYYEFLNMGFRLAASAGSDFPYGCHIGDQRCYVYTGAGEQFDVDAWFEGHRSGRTFVTQGPLIDFRVDGETAGAVLERDAGGTVRVSIEAVGDPDIGSPKTVSLIQFGKTLHTVASEDVNVARLSGEWDVPIPRSCWLAARVDAHNGAVAHTSPVYVVVDGQPTIDPTQLRAICEFRLHRLASLRTGIDAMIAEFQEHGAPVRPRGRTQPLTSEETQQLLYQQWGKMFSTDRDAILDRLARAETYYRDLLQHAAGSNDAPLR